MRTRRALLMVLAATLPALAQDSLDPVFVTVPFNQWLVGPDVAPIPCEVYTSPPGLTAFQRIQVNLKVTVAGAQFAERPVGHLLILMQLTDSAGHVYQTHGDGDLARANGLAKGLEVTAGESALMLPGDYELAVALFYTGTGEHSLRRRKVHIPPFGKLPKVNGTKDPLPGAWQGLPAVQFLGRGDPSASWPDRQGLVRLPLETRSSVRIELLMILPVDRDVSSLVPLLQVISCLAPSKGSISVAVLDVLRQRVSFEQDLSGGQRLDWPRLNGAFQEADPRMIDVGSLQNRRASLDFLQEQIGNRIRPTAAASRKVLIILSEPIKFPKDIPVHRIQQDGSGGELYYLRYGLRRYHAEEMGPGPGPGQKISRDRSLSGDPNRTTGLGEDILEATLKPLHPHLFDVAGPMSNAAPVQFRKALATMLKGIASR
jgi:hypothetical protein